MDRRSVGMTNPGCRCGEATVKMSRLSDEVRLYLRMFNGTALGRISSGI